MTRTQLTLKLVGGVVYPVLFFGMALFIPAWTVHWWRAWVFMGVVLVAASVTMFAIFPSRPELLEERYKPAIQEGQPLLDKILTPMLVLSFLGLIIFIPIDRFHLRLFEETGPVVAGVGLVLFVLGWTLIALSMKENAFAAPVVKDQTDRGQVVIETGPYRVIRHPMYAGMVPVVVGMALWLGSWAALLVALLPVTVVVVRVQVEETMLKRTLPGYVAYCERVRWRLVPGVW